MEVQAGLTKYALRSYEANLGAGKVGIECYCSAESY